MSNKVYVDDIGTQISVDVGTTISGATEVTLEVKKSDGTAVSWDASVSGQTASVTIESGDFDVAGIYLLQVKLTIDGFTGKGETTSFTVYKAFE